MHKLNTAKIFFTGFYQNMKVNRIQQSPAFSGYKNIYTRTIKSNPDTHLFSHMAMQLDNIGHNDLDLWIDIQKKVLKKDTTTDIISFAFASSPLMQSHFWLNGKDINTDQLKKSSIYSQTDMDVFKTFSFIAQLTKRLMNENSALVLDNDTKSDVLETARRSLEAMFTARKHSYDSEAAKLANEIILATLFNPQKPQENAGIINIKLNELMKECLSS